MWKSYVTLFFLFLSPTTAEIKSLTIKSDTRPMIFFEKFGFAFKGQVTISISSVSVFSSSLPESSHLGFVLINDEVLPQVLIKIQQNPSFCVFEYHYIYHLFTFLDLYPRDLSPPPSASFNRSYTIFAPKEYSLFFINCAFETSISMIVRTEIFNLDSNGSKDYLSVGQTQLPTLFFFFFLVYLTFFVVWIYTCYINKHSIHHIHLLMTVLLLIKGLNLITAAEDKHYVKVTGHGWNVWFYIFQFIRVVFLFNIVILVGAGWCFLKSFLQDREKKVLMIVIPLQVLANLISFVIGETDPFIKDWATWNQVFLVVNIICCCAIIFPIVWSIESLRETSKTDGKGYKNLAKLTLFRQFYIVIIGYLCFTRIIVFALRTIAAYKYQWVGNAAEETTSFVFFIVMFYMFRPVEKNECFV
ncbi:protein CANDIDATE G-PROTEIN COUPLED RECEPTOR [Trifolium repens]|nr:protein CANDIDATE G-PROTEIN COUPLED RECEPTOR [Trifolium repens]